MKIRTAPALRGGLFLTAVVALAMMVVGWSFAFIPSPIAAKHGQVSVLDRGCGAALRAAGGEWPRRRARQPSRPSRAGPFLRDLVRAVPRGIAGAQPAGRTRRSRALAVLAISVAEVEPRVRRFVETMPVNFPILLDRDRAVAKAWNVATLPTTFVLDANLEAAARRRRRLRLGRSSPRSLIDIARARPARVNTKSNQSPREDNHDLSSTRSSQGRRGAVARRGTAALRRGASRHSRRSRAPGAISRS